VAGPAGGCEGHAGLARRACSRAGQLPAGGELLAQHALPFKCASHHTQRCCMKPAAFIAAHARCVAEAGRTCPEGWDFTACLGAGAERPAARAHRVPAGRVPCAAAHLHRGGAGARGVPLRPAAPAQPLRPPRTPAAAAAAAGMRPATSFTPSSAVHRTACEVLLITLLWAARCSGLLHLSPSLDNLHAGAEHRR
jgi:hypothetical protein